MPSAHDMALAKHTRQTLDEGVLLERMSQPTQSCNVTHPPPHTHTYLGSQTLGRAQTQA